MERAGLSYAVRVTKPANRDIDSITFWWTENRDARQARRWYNGILRALGILAKRPMANEIAPEIQFTRREVRQYHYGIGGKSTHRILYTVDGGDIVVLRVRHLAQDILSSEDLDIGT